MEARRGKPYGDAVADVIPIDHIRRSQRLFRILVERLGLEHFLDEAERRYPRLDRRALDETTALCADWIERRTGGAVPDASREVMERQLRRLLIARVAERLLRVADS